MFPTFPGGWPGVGLLLLRAAVVVTVLAQCIAYAVDWHHLGFVTAAVGFLAIASSVSLLIGYLTPFSAVLVGLIVSGAQSKLIRYQVFDCASYGNRRCDHLPRSGSIFTRRPPLRPARDHHSY